MQRETRVFVLDTRDLRADGAGQTFVGHAAVYNRLSQELWGFYERVAPGAFQSAVDGKDDVRFLINHDPSLLLARSTSGTLRFADDEIGLGVEADLPKTTYAADLAESMSRGDMDQMSFGFRVPPGGDDWAEEEVETEEGTVRITVRTLNEVELFDVSVVTFPAYLATDAELQALRYLGVRPAWAVPEPAKRVGKVLSAKNAGLVQSAMDALGTLLIAAEEEEGEQIEEKSLAPVRVLARRRLRLLERQ